MIIRIEDGGITKDININHVSMVYYYFDQTPNKAVIYYEHNAYSYEQVIGDEAVKQLQNVFASNLKKVIVSGGKSENTVSVSPLPENLAQVKEIVKNRALNQPFTESELRRFTIEELEFFRSELMDRVSSELKESLDYLRSNQFRTLTTPIQSRIEVKWYEDQIDIKFDGNIVFQPDYDLLILGEWIDLIPSLVSEIKAETERNRIVNDSNRRDELISQMTGNQKEKPMPF